MSDKVRQTTDATGVGPVTVTWGVNGWVMVETQGRSGQRQVRSRHDLADLLAGLGMPPSAAEEEARSLWHARPSDAAAETSRPYQEMWRATGLPPWAVAVILLGIIALYVLYRAAHLRP
jgi:hypothetical protein